jgi:cytochrome c-type biogenesis protein CcmH
MLLWIVIAALTAIALAAIILPLIRKDTGTVPTARYDAAVYRDQLAEIDREVQRGQLGEKEAEAARAEIGRRLLAAAAEADRDEQAGGGEQSVRMLKTVILTGLIGVPLASLAIYLMLGSPLQPGLPYAERMASAMQNRDYDALVEQVETHLANAPEDAQGWLVLAPIYMRQGRYQDAANALARVMALKGERDDLMADLGEALVLGNNNIVSEEARKAFDRSLALNAGNEKALYYQGVIAIQDGRRDEALKIWRDLVAKAPKDAPWLGFVKEKISELAGETGSGQAPALSREQVEGVTSQNAQTQQEMIRSMVDGLASRLAEGGGPVEEWLKLARARVVLGERDAARKAIADARAQYAGDNAALTRIDETSRDLGLSN